MLQVLVAWLLVTVPSVITSGRVRPITLQQDGGLPRITSVQTKDGASTLVSSSQSQRNLSMTPTEMLEEGIRQSKRFVLHMTLILSLPLVTFVYLVVLLVRG